MLKRRRQLHVEHTAEEGELKRAARIEAVVVVVLLWPIAAARGATGIFDTHFKSLTSFVYVLLSVSTTWNARPRIGPRAPFDGGGASE